MAPSAPKPCARFKRMPLSPKFIEHLPKVDACKAAVAYLRRESDSVYFCISIATDWRNDTLGDKLPLMDSLSAIPAKSTCQFKKDNGEFCRRTLNRPETMCWQHATTLPHKWKSLTKNQTVIFIATMLGLAVALVVGVPGTYFSYRGWHDPPKWKVPSIPAPVATLGKDTTPTTTPSTPSARKPPKHTKPLTTLSPQPQAPDVSMTFYIEGGNPRFSIFNSGDEAAQQPKWSFALVGLTNEYYPRYPSDPNSSQPLPIPTNKIDDYVKPHSYPGIFAVFNNATANLIKSGDQIFGFVGISCATVQETGAIGCTGRWKTEAGMLISYR